MTDTETDQQPVTRGRKAPCTILPDWIASCDAPQQAKVLYWNLAIMASEQSSELECEATDAEVAERLGRAEGTVRKSLKEARAAGLVLETMRIKNRVDYRGPQPVAEPAIRVLTLAGLRRFTEQERAESM